VYWELIFMLVILKIPIVYLCAVVWWAIRAEPQPLEGAGRLAPLTPTPPQPSWSQCGWSAQRARVLRRGPVPRGGRRAGRPIRVVSARAGRLTRVPM
jgi:hypothetical protein